MNELKEAFAKAGNPLSSHDLAELHKLADKNADGVIDFKEFKA